MNEQAHRDTIHHDVAGQDVFDRQDERVREYREKWEKNPERLDCGSFPLHLDIESTSYCNLRCPFCATTYSHFENGYMEWETFRAIIDEASEKGLYACKLNFRGEPLLHKRLGDFIRYAKDKGILDVFFNTNAVLLTAERVEELIDSGLDRLTVSFEGFEKATYERSRVGAKFEEAVGNVEMLRAIRDAKGVSQPRIRVQTVLLPELRDRMDDYVEFWKDRADQVSYNDLEPAADTVKEKIQLVESSWICPFPYQRMTIMWDGTMTACKNDYNGKLALGRIPDTTIQDAWVKELDTLRKKHRQGKAHEIEACGECPLRMSELVKRGEVEVQQPGRHGDQNQMRSG